MVEKRQQFDSSLMFVIVVALVAILVLVSNSNGVVGERTSGFRLVPQMEVPTRDIVVAPSLPLPLWDRFIKIFGSPVLTSSSQEGVDLVLRSVSKPWPPAATGTCGSGAGGLGDSWEPGLGLCLLDCSNPQNQIRLAGSTHWDDWWEWSAYSPECGTGGFMGDECCFMCGDGQIDNNEECDPGSTIGPYSWDPASGNTCTCTSNCECSTGCTDPTACNYNSGAGEDDGSCWYGIAPCDCDDSEGDVDYGCGCGAGPPFDCTSPPFDESWGCGSTSTCTIDDCESPSGCDNACGSTLENDECGECGGDGADVVCTGGSVVCDSSDCPDVGCTDGTACNYNPDATVDDGSCTVNDCAGECGGDAIDDECGVCDGDGPGEDYDCSGNCISSSCYSFCFYGDLISTDDAFCDQGGHCSLESCQSDTNCDFCIENKFCLTSDDAGIRGHVNALNNFCESFDGSGIGFSKTGELPSNGYNSAYWYNDGCGGSGDEYGWMIKLDCDLPNGYVGHCKWGNCFWNGGPNAIAWGYLDHGYIRNYMDDWGGNPVPISIYGGGSYVDPLSYDNQDACSDEMGSGGWQC